MRLHKKDEGAGFYTRAGQGEGKGTYEGLHRTQRLIIVRVLCFLIAVVVLAFLGVAIQANIKGQGVEQQAKYDYNYLVGSRMGGFSTCDLNHTCKNGHVDQSNRHIADKKNVQQ